MQMTDEADAEQGDDPEELEVFYSCFWTFGDDRPLRLKCVLD